MDIKYVPIDQVMPYENNPRVNAAAVEKVAMSLKRYGWQQPIVVDARRVIIAGHTRLLAAQSLGMQEVPIKYAIDLTPAEVKAYRLADNRVAQESQWDVGKLVDELKGLFDDNFDLSLTGFSSDELNGFLNSENPLLTDDLDSTPSHNDSVEVLRGEVWLLGSHRLMCGDSTSSDDVDRLFNGNKPTLMVTDPPYGVSYDPAWREGIDEGYGKRVTGKVMNDDRADWRDAYALYPGDVAYVWHSALHSHTVAQNLIDCDFKIVSQIIWAKQHFALSRGDYHWQHEPCWYVVRNGKKHNWNGARDQASVWEIKNNNSFGNSDKEEVWGHGTQKPAECMLRPIENNSKPLDIVYDPFCGSGTTLVACEKLNRMCLAMELDPKYCSMIIKRFEHVTGKKAVREER